MWVISIKMHPKCDIGGQISKLLYHYLFLRHPNHTPRERNRPDKCNWQNTALATLYIGGSVTCSQTKTQGA